MTPFELFDRWFQEAVQAGQPQPEAMALATAAADGTPSVRMVLFKSWSPAGVDFYTNLESRKGRELEANPRAAVTVHWSLTRHQVRAAGTVVRLSGRESAVYWATRSRESQAAATASAQSRPIASRQALVAAQREVLEAHRDLPIPLPADWGGYRLSPDWVEFWEGRPDRLHERRLFTRAGAGWREELLAP